MKKILFAAIVVLASAIIADAHPNILKELKGIAKNIGTQVGRDAVQTGENAVGNLLNKVLGGDKSSKSNNSDQNTNRNTRSNSTPNTYRSGQTTSQKSAIRSYHADDTDISTENGSINYISVERMTMDNPMFRIVNGGLYLDNGGISLGGNISVTVKGKRGKRIVCIIEPILNGKKIADNIGECQALIAFTPTSDNFTGNVAYALPYSWMGIDMNSRITDVNGLQIEVALADWSNSDVLAQRTTTIDGSDINIDRQSLPMDLLSSFLGGGVDGDVVHTCSACDGTGLCNSCDGDAYLDPSVCRKCVSSPGVCRRCGGKGKEGAEVYDGGGLFDIF